jgi:hypothetical protein
MNISLKSYSKVRCRMTEGTANFNFRINFCHSLPLTGFNGKKSPSIRQRVVRTLLSEESAGFVSSYVYLGQQGDADNSCSTPSMASGIAVNHCKEGDSYWYKFHLTEGKRSWASSPHLTRLE